VCVSPLPHERANKQSLARVVGVVVVVVVACVCVWVSPSPREWLINNL
jgi:hypothetical protein